jgi:transcriptional regulator with XRE-family HTH domain
MNNFGPVLSECIERNNTNKRTIATAAGISPSNLTRLANGDIRPEPETLDLLLRQFTAKADKLTLIRAYLRDVLGPDPNSVASAHGTVLYDGLRPMDTLSLRGQAALEYLLKLRPQVPSIEDVFIELATCMGWKEESDPRIVYPPPVDRASVVNEEPPKQTKKIADGRKAARQ